MWKSLWTSSSFLATCYTLTQKKSDTGEEIFRIRPARRFLYNHKHMGPQNVHLECIGLLVSDISVFLFLLNRSEIRNREKLTTLLLKQNNKWAGWKMTANQPLQTPALLHRSHTHKHTDTRTAYLCLQQHIWVCVLLHPLSNYTVNLLLCCMYVFVYVCLTYQSCDFVCHILPSVQSPCRFCLPDDLRDAAGSAEILPPKSHLGSPPSTPTPRPGCPLQTETKCHIHCVSGTSP